MPSRTSIQSHGERPGAFLLGSAAGLAAVVLAGAVFLVTLTLVATEWPWLVSADAAAVNTVNGFVSDHPFLVRTLQVVTAFGGSQAAVILFPAGVLWLLIRRQPRLAGFAAVCGIGMGILIACSKALVDRPRPVVGTAYAHVTDASFPSGHTLSSTVTYGVLLMVFAPVVAPAWRKIMTGAVVALVVAVGLSRIALGVHFPSDVVGGWTLGVLWIVAVTAAFTRTTPSRAKAPWRFGLEPDNRARLEPAPAEDDLLPRGWVTAGQLTAAWVVIGGALTGVGLWITSSQTITELDRTVVQWFVDARAGWLDPVVRAVSHVGATPTVIAVFLAAAPLAVAITRRWAPVLFLAVAIVGETALYLVASTIVSRPRPSVNRLSHGLPDSASYPSGHVAASVVVLGALALLVRSSTRHWFARLATVLAVLLPVLVALARLYRGVHYPTDVLASLVFAAAWLAACWWTLRPLDRDAHDKSADTRSSMP